MKRRVLAECFRIATENNTPEKHPEWGCYHHFSFVVQNDRIVEWGTNRRSSPLTEFGYLPHTKMHAEADAYFKARGILDKKLSFEIVNIRVTKSNKIRESTPCHCCWNFLKRFGCKGVWFTLDEGMFAYARLQ